MDGNKDSFDPKSSIRENLLTNKNALAWIECSPVCTKILDLEYNLHYMSSSGIEGLKIDNISDYYGKPYPFSFYPESFKELTISSLDKAKKTGEPVSQEAPVVDIKGNELWFHSTIIPIKDGSGLITEFMVVSIDTTKRNEYEIELKKKNKDLEKYNQTVTQMNQNDNNH